MLFRRKHFPKMGKIRYNGWFNKMAMIPFDMIIFKETGRLFFYESNSNFLNFISQNWQVELYLMTFKLLLSNILQGSFVNLDGKVKCLKPCSHEILLRFSKQCLYS